MLIACCAAQRVAIAALWLASKLEEAPKKFHHVLMVFARIDSRAEERSPELLDPHSQVRARRLPTPAFSNRVAHHRQTLPHHALCIASRS